MGDVPPPDPGADLAALTASLQVDARDVAVFFRVLAATLESALPATTTIERERSLLRSRRLARKVTVRTGDDTFEAELAGGGMSCRRVHSVHGVGGGMPWARDLEVNEWVAELRDAVAHDATTSAAAAEALRSLTT